jgi:hypothetical protein
MSRIESTFGALVLAQAAHSTEETLGQLWASFPPARFVAGFVSDNPAHGFLFLNVCLVAFGLWCYFWPVRRRWPVAAPILWLWIIVETINGVVPAVVRSPGRVHAGRGYIAPPVVSGGVSGDARQPSDARS